jgi:hypothetical protein
MFWGRSSPMTFRNPILSYRRGPTSFDTPTQEQQ